MDPSLAPLQSQQATHWPQRMIKAQAPVSSRLALVWLDIRRNVPRSALLVIGLLAAINVGVWVFVAVLLAALHKTNMLATCALAYSLGLRHALDGDHISAIDLVTRQLISAGQRPSTVGTFFSLGHSTVVVVTSIVVAATSASISKRFNGFSNVGGIIGTSVSAAFLLILGAFNTYTLVVLVRRIRAYTRGEDVGDAQQGLVVTGPISRLCKRLFRLIDRPWKMLPLGIVFGLGFDTSSEIAILGIAAVESAAGTSFWLILVFPLLFTAGMCLLDTADGALMMSLYTAHTSPLKYLYYSGILTAMTSVIAIVIGVIQVLSLVQNVADPQGRFWDGVAAAGDNFDVIGGSIVGGFVLVAIVSVAFYGRFERWANARRALALGERGEEGEVELPYIAAHGGEGALDDDKAIHDDNAKEIKQHKAEVCSSENV